MGTSHSDFPSTRVFIKPLSVSKNYFDERRLVCAVGLTDTSHRSTCSAMHLSSTPQTIYKLRSLPAYCILTQRATKTGSRIKDNTADKTALSVTVSWVKHLSQEFSLCKEYFFVLDTRIILTQYVVTPFLQKTISKQLDMFQYISHVCRIVNALMYLRVVYLYKLFFLCNSYKSIFQGRFVTLNMILKVFCNWTFVISKSF